MYPTPNELCSYNPAWPCAHFRLAGGVNALVGVLFYIFYSACRRRGGVLKWPRFCIFFFFSVSQVGAALMGDTAGTSRVSRPKHGV